MPQGSSKLAQGVSAETDSRSALEFLNPLRERLEQRIGEYLSPAGRRGKPPLLSDDCPAPLRGAMQYSLLAGGKRLRPMLVVLAAEACGAAVEAALPAACAVEMIHTYSLIHDDLPAMDDDDLRRGRPTSHKKFGEALAILAGDALLTLAFEVVARDVQPAERAARCCAALASAAGACALVGGQVDDLAFEQRWINATGPGADAARAGPDGLAELESIHRRKTGALFLASVCIGGIIAAANDEHMRLLDRYGRSIGLAFQITDDLLDVRGRQVDLGKRVGKDSDRGKLTYPGLLGVEESVRRAEELVEQAAAAAAALGPGAKRLERLARFVLKRDR
jgi:geranylgeranyl diphosphate synthase type II